MKSEIPILRSSLALDADIAVVLNDNAPLSGIDSQVYFAYDNANRGDNCILATNTQIEDVIQDPRGDVWAADGQGYIYTTAELIVEIQPLDSNLEYVSAMAEFKFKAHRISQYGIRRLWAVENSIWVFCEDGTAMVIEEGDVSSMVVATDILSVNGSSMQNIYVGTADSRILHFDGNQWHDVDLPETGLPRVSYQSIYINLADDVFALSTNGVIMRGNAHNGFRIIEAPVLRYTGMCGLNGHYYISAAESGIYEVVSLEEPLRLQHLKKARSPLSLIGRGNTLRMTCATAKEYAYYLVLELAGAQNDVKRMFENKLK